MTDKKTSGRRPTRVQGCALALSGIVLGFGGCFIAIVNDRERLASAVLIGGCLVAVVGFVLFAVGRSGNEPREW